MMVTSISNGTSVTKPKLRAEELGKCPLLTKLSGINAAYLSRKLKAAQAKRLESILQSTSAPLSALSTA
eukprot:3179555-Amphidinium_carterae.1